MVLESIIGYQGAKNKPLILVAVGAANACISLLLAQWVFPSHVSLTALFFTVLSCVPLFIKAIEGEETLDEQSRSERSLLREHGRVILFLCCLFIGMLIGFTGMFLFSSPEDAGKYFDVQMDTFCKINQKSNYQNCMQQYGLTGYASQPLQPFFTIINNNLKVLFVCALFSFLYGSGAIYILTWNAMVLSVAIGYHAKQLFVETAPFLAVMISSISFLKHGLLEMAAYFIAGLAGGILSVAVVKHKFGSGFRRVIFDSAWMFGLSIVVIILAAVLEVFI